MKKILRVGLKVGALYLLCSFSYSLGYSYARLEDKGEV
jgi:hypothetical protein